MNNTEKRTIIEWFDAHTVMCGPCNEIVSLGSLFDPLELINIIEKEETARLGRLATGLNQA